MDADPRRVALRLGFEPITIDRLRSRGHLSKLALTEAEIHRRLYRAHRAYLHTKGEQIMDVSIPSEHRARPSLIVVAVAAVAIGAGAAVGAYEAFGSGQSVRPATPSAPAKPSFQAKLDRGNAGSGDCPLSRLVAQPC